MNQVKLLLMKAGLEECIHSIYPAGSGRRSTSSGMSRPGIILGLDHGRARYFEKGLRVGNIHADLGSRFTLMGILLALLFQHITLYRRQKVQRRDFWFIVLLSVFLIRQIVFSRFIELLGLGCRAKLFTFGAVSSMQCTLYLQRS